MQCIRKRVQAAVDVAVPDGPRPRLQYRVGRPYVEICAEAAEGRQDLILLGYEHEKGILDLGNTAGRVAHSSPCPVLVLRPRLG
jgi:nucleotide-binding universal stress UspA family protein